MPHISVRMDEEKESDKDDDENATERQRVQWGVCYFLDFFCLQNVEKIDLLANQCGSMTSCLARNVMVG